MRELTLRQKEVLSFIGGYIRSHNYPPTIREIADHFEISVKGAHDHIVALRRKGKIKQTDKRSRTMELVYGPGEGDMAMLVEVPILGTVAAGLPILSEENYDGALTLHKSMLKKNRSYFAMKVRGDSMSGVGIMNGDMAIIEKTENPRNGEIVVAQVDDEAITLKRYYKETYRIKLQAENPDYPPIYSRNVKVVGRLSRIHRSY